MSFHSGALVGEEIKDPSISFGDVVNDGSYRLVLRREQPKSSRRGFLALIAGGTVLAAAGCARGLLQQEAPIVTTVENTDGTSSASTVTATNGTQTMLGVNVAQAQAQGIYGALRDIKDPSLQSIVQSYAATRYFQDGLARGEKNRLWVITAAAGVQDLWDNPERRAKLQQVGFVSAADALDTLVRIGEIESGFGTTLGNSRNGSVYGIWHAQNVSWLNAAMEYLNADDMGQTQAAWDQTKSIIHESQARAARLVDSNHRTPDPAQARRVLNQALDAAAQTPAGQIIIKARSYGRSGSKGILLMLADMMHDTMRQTGLTTAQVRADKSLRYVVHMLGYPNAPRLLSCAGGTDITGMASWRDEALGNPSVFRHRTRSGIQAEISSRFTTLSVQRLHARTGWTLPALSTQTAALSPNGPRRA